MQKTAIHFFIIILLHFCSTILAQEPEVLYLADDTSKVFFTPLSPDTIAPVIKSDTIIPKKKAKKSAIDQPVKYNSKDSMKFDLETKKVYLYGDASILYQDIDLKADYIEFDMSSNIVFASGWPNDTSGVIEGKPEFKQGSETFLSEEMTYNFKTKKGYITNIFSEQNGGYLHSQITKRTPEGYINMRKGKYTTCDDPHPHFYMMLSKAKAIPEDKIVSGPAYIVVADVPLPLGVPFGLFPNTKGAKSGVLIPTYGEEKIRGFNLKNGGYYWNMNEYVDMTFIGDIYTSGSWGLSHSMKYNWRYQFAGNTMFRWQKDKLITLTDTSIQTNYNILWTHRQDPKANPYSTFSANVDMSSSTYDRLNSYSMSNRLSSTKQSSIMYTRRWPTLPFNLSTGIRHSQNNQTGEVVMEVPSFSLNSNTIYPFRRKNPTGKLRWYENFQTVYSSNLDNTVYTNDSSMFTRHVFDSLNTGFKHGIPLNTNIKIGNFMNITPGVRYEGMIYTRYVQKVYDNNYVDTLTNSHLRVSEHDTLAYIHGWSPTIGFTLNPKLYGMYQIRNSNVKAIRHVMSPTASFSYIPDMKKYAPDYYESYVDQSQRDPNDTSQFKTVYYSKYEKGRYGTPTARGQSGSISLSLRNTVEMKMISKKDTTQTVKKVPILENLDFTTSINPFAEEGQKKLGNINMNVGTRLFEGKYNIRMTGLFNPYQYTKTPRLNDPTQFFYKDTVAFLINGADGKLARLTNLTFSFGTSIRPKQGEKKDKPKTPLNTNEINPATGLPYGYYVDFDIPWTLDINYDLSYSKPYEQETITQTVRVSGDVSLTKKWKIGLGTGYDIENKKMAATNLNITRDLHCWIMRFTCIPFGTYQMYNFTIGVQAPMLADLKYEKKQSWYDSLY